MFQLCFNIFARNFNSKCVKCQCKLTISSCITSLPSLDTAVACFSPRGEKYMGLWLDDQRHGAAAVINQHGVYYEGSFRENKMSVSDPLTR